MSIDPEVRSVVGELTVDAATAILAMSSDWQVCRRGRLDARGANKAFWQGGGAVERTMLRQGRRQRFAYRLNGEFGQSVRHMLDGSKVRSDRL